MPEMETALLEEASYKAAQEANEEFFVSTNDLVDEAYQAFETKYANSRRIKVDLTGMTSRSRILLFRQIIQKFADIEKNQVSML
jgi:hypothetical protein